MKPREKSVELVPDAAGMHFFLVMRGRGTRVTAKFSRKTLKRLRFEIDDVLRNTKQTPMFQGEIDNADIRNEEEALSGREDADRDAPRDGEFPETRNAGPGDAGIGAT